SLYAIRSDGSVARKESVSRIVGNLDTSVPFGCAWSDDLNRLAFEAATGEELAEGGQPLYGLFLYDFTTRKRRLLTPKGMSGGSPVWQNRNVLVFTSGRNTRRYTPAQIQTLEVNTGTMRPLVPNASNAAIARRGA
ncbi:MAG: hypothetical protein V4671_15795, partial [Armatimonadota bacterium]